MQKEKYYTNRIRDDSLSPLQKRYAKDWYSGYFASDQSKWNFDNVNIKKMKAQAEKGNNRAIAFMRGFKTRHFSKR